MQDLIFPIIILICFFTLFVFSMLDMLKIQTLENKIELLEKKLTKTNLKYHSYDYYDGDGTWGSFSGLTSVKKYGIVEHEQWPE